VSIPVALRTDYDAIRLRRLARQAKDGPQTRRLLALAAIYDGGTRTEAAQIGGVGLQTVRDWVLRFNAHGPDGLLDGKAPGQPSILSQQHRQHLVQMIEDGPIPAVHGVVRWRLVDLMQWLWEEYQIAISKQTLSREVRALDYRKLSARPRHHAQAAGVMDDFKKASPRVWRRSRPARPAASRSRSGLPTRRVWARRTRSPGAGPSAAPVPRRRAI
jgi:transposase